MRPGYVLSYYLPFFSIPQLCLLNSRQKFTPPSFYILPTITTSRCNLPITCTPQPVPIDCPHPPITLLQSFPFTSLFSHSSLNAAPIPAKLSRVSVPNLLSPLRFSLLYTLSQTVKNLLSQISFHQHLTFIKITKPITNPLSQNFDTLTIFSLQMSQSVTLLLSLFPLLLYVRRKIVLLFLLTFRSDFRPLITIQKTRYHSKSNC